ncbi:LURP-one-related/scramblase family protein [Secundilactobacillus similis]|uniref:Uncharacterized protein n=1 Tax=Secundilactobacillus similis DSM 23365 = JCM 2765 TaxID=1423804 RepID=A0A0R2EV66_9LACO|nr:hypothetical protein [Secundilactobacillus similis]KRN20338.1 hypothetical protein FD14_GL001496 [Secundilactobacillus similis DSM 23365 = JCM 2765]
MRTLYIRQDSLATKGASVVRDADKRSIYLLIGKWGRHQDALSLYQISGDLLAELKQTSLGILPRFDIYYHNQKVGAISKHLGLLNEVIYVSNLHWLIVGNIVTGDYRIYHGTTLIMTSQGDGDLRALTVENRRQEPVCICIAATLDHWASHRRKLQLPKRTWRASFNVPMDMRGNRAWRYEQHSKKRTPLR